MADRVATVVPARAAPRRRLLGEQALVLGGQLAAGVGHLAFAVVVARVLSPADFAAFAAFQAMYLVARALVSSLIAGGSLDPSWSARARGRMRRVAVRLGLVVVVGSLVAGHLVHLPLPMALSLAAAGPSAVLFALDQGRLFGLLRHRRAVAGQVAGPAARMVLGVPLAVGLGATGAAVATVIGGYVAAGVVWPRRNERATVDEPAPPTAPAVARPGPGAVPATIVAFLLLSVVQNQDVVLANRVLDGVEAGHFAAISTLGGAVAFATASVPFVFLPRARTGRGALGPALAVSGLLGVVPALAVAVAAEPLISVVLGQRYVDVAPVAGRYVVAMAFLGVARVLVAHLCSRPRWPRLAPTLVGVAVAGQVAGLVTVGHDVAAVVGITLATTAFLAASSAIAVALDIRFDRSPAPAVDVLPPPEPVARPADADTDIDAAGGAGPDEATPRTRRMTTAVVGITLAGLIVRLATASRSVWVDEAISIHQATMPFGDMLQDLSSGDVHPPLHNVVLWGVVRVLGTSELALRLPSIVAGTLMLPVVYAVAKAAFERRTALVATVLAAVSPFLVWYSQEARMYGFVMLFALVSLWAQLRALERGRWWYWLLFSVASAAMVWTHYFALVPLAVQQLVVAWEWRRRWRDGNGALRLFVGWMGSLVVTAALVAPLVPFFLRQLDTNRAVGAMAGGEGTVQQAGAAPESAMSVYRVGANLVWALWGFHPDEVMTRIAALWPLLMLLALFLLGRGWSRGARWLTALAVVPVVMFVALGVVRDGLFEARYFGPAVAPLLILAASWIVGTARTTIRVVVATTVLAATMVVGLVDQQLNNQNPRVYDFAGALTEVEDLVEPGDTFVYGPDYLGTVVEYYAPDVDAHVVGEPLPPIGDGERVVVLGSFLDIRSVSGKLGALLSELDREATLVETIHKGTEVRIWVYE